MRCLAAEISLPHLPADQAHLMGILFCCPSCDHPLNIKAHLAGRTGFCPHCRGRLEIPSKSQMDMGQFEQKLSRAQGKQIAATERAGSQVLPSSSTSRQETTKGSAKSTALQKKSSDTELAGVRAANSPESGSPAIPLAEPVEDPAEDDSDVPVFEAIPHEEIVRNQDAETFTATKPGAPSETPDPLRESPHQQWYVRPPSGGQFGPASADLMEKWIDEGRVTGDSYVWREGWENWKLGAEVFSDLSSSSAVMGAMANTVFEVPGSIRARAAYMKARRRRTIWGIIGLVVGTIIVIFLIAILFVVIQKQNQVEPSTDENAFRYAHFHQELPC